MEHFFLSIGISWTLSKVLPFVLFLVIGFLLFIYIKRRSFKFAKFIAIILIPVPVLIYFVLNPIYEGDFSNNSTKVSNKEITELNEGLTVLAIPGCPFCYESIEVLSEIKSRTETNDIRFMVISSDSTSTDWYNEKSNGRIPVGLINIESDVKTLTNGHFPTYVYYDGEGKFTVWSNANFGVLAKDEVEELLSE